MALDYQAILKTATQGGSLPNAAKETIQGSTNQPNPPDQEQSLSDLLKVSEPDVTPVAPVEQPGFLKRAADLATRFLPSVETIGSGLAAGEASKMQGETDARSAALADAATKMLKNPNLTAEQRNRVMHAMQNLSTVEGSVRGNSAMQETPLQSLGKFLTTAGTLSSGAFAEGGAAAFGVKRLAGRAALSGLESAGTFGVGGALENKESVIPSAIIAGGLGFLGPVAGDLGKYLSEKVSPRVLNGIMKPLGKEFNFGKNPGNIVKEGIVGNTREGFLKNIVSKKQEVGTLIEQALTEPSVAAKTIDVTPLLSPIDEAVQKAVAHGDQELVNRLLQVKQGITDTFQLAGSKVESTGKKNLILTPKDAQLLKRDIGEAVRWRDPLDGEINKVRASVYRNIDAAIDTAAPGIDKLNQRYANLLGAQKSMERTLNILQRQNLATFSQLGIGGITAAGAFATGDQTPEALAKGVAAALALKGLRTAAVQTRLAQVLSRMDPAESKLIQFAAPKLKTAILKAVTGSGFNPDDSADQLRSALEGLTQ